MWSVSRSADWRKHGQVWHLHLAGVWVAVVWQTREGWRWHNFAESGPALGSEAEARAAAERACG